ncbi:hypothetical protein O181_056105 [Austropuccinia psidii MF-1]|uniref:Matrin-type domain-containing protein n=1 Tax=Austropuccinia psidii MF-1 TaxID=1389203 RepID=A0A9Q3E5K7_9BASI|nr:hypothetical protein [Austropuccinia psidii MF-1]
MTEYWVSQKSYFCKYCDIYIRDDKPSRAQHENGLRHKGNLERYIREIYKKEERTKKERADEATQILKINEAARLSHAQNDCGELLATNSKRSKTDSDEEQSTEQKAESSKRQRQAAGDWKGAGIVENYSDARSLGLVDDEIQSMVTAQTEKEVRATEGLIGRWEAVKKLPPTANKPAPITLDNSISQKRMTAKLTVEREPEKAGRQKLFSERKLDSDSLDFLDGMEIKLKVDRRVKEKIKTEF